MNNRMFLGEVLIDQSYWWRSQSPPPAPTVSPTSTAGGGGMGRSAEPFISDLQLPIDS